MTIAKFVPIALGALLDEPAMSECRDLRAIFSGGEPLSEGLRQRFFRTMPGCELHNLYGPTEATVDTTFHTCSPAETLRLWKL